MGVIGVNSRPKVYVTDHQFENLAIESEILGEAQAELTDLQTRDPLQVAERAQDADALFNLYTKLDGDILKRLPRLKVIVRYGVGVDTVDLEAATQLGIYVANVPDYGVDEVSTHALSLLLGLARKTCLYDRKVRGGTWDVKLGKPIRRLIGQKVGLVGFGRIPKLLTPKLQVLGFEVLACDPYVSADAMRAVGVRPCDSLAGMASEVDYLSVHVPLGRDTRHLISAEVLQVMKRSAYLINTSRGATVDEMALIRALTEGEIAGAALDVMEQEPPAPDNPLLWMDNVILTPHAAYYSEEAFVDLRKKAAQQICEVLRGGVPENLVNKEVLQGP